MLSPRTYRVERLWALGDPIDTVEGVVRVQEEGRRKRAEAEAQMQQTTVEMKKALVEAG